MACSKRTPYNGDVSAAELTDTNRIQGTAPPARQIIDQVVVAELPKAL